MTTTGQTIATEGRNENAPTVGDMILDSQEQTEDFRHVSKIWQSEGCMSYKQARTQLASEQQQIEDIHGPLIDWDIEAHNDRISFVHLPTSREYTPTAHALNLMCQVGKGMSSWAVRAMTEPIPHRTKKDDDDNPIAIDGGERSLWDYEVLRDYLKVHLLNGERVNQDQTRLFRTWKDGTLRALLSEQYTIVNNSWFLDVVERAIPGGLVSHWKGDADSIFGNILIPDTIRTESDSDFGGMLSIGNSEIGTRRISSLPSVFRAICMNGCIWDQQSGEGINKVHRGAVDFTALATLIVENLQKQIPLVSAGIDKLLSLRTFGCGEVTMPQLLAQTAADFSLSKKQTSAVYSGWCEELSLLGPKEGHTAYGLANAVTRAGQSFSNEQWVRFDTIGGQFANMDRNDWDAFRSRAGHMTTKQIERRVSSDLVAV